MDSTMICGCWIWIRPVPILRCIDAPSGVSPMRMGMGQRWIRIMGSFMLLVKSTTRWQKPRSATMRYANVGRNNADGDSLPALTEASVAWNSRFNGFLLVGGQSYYQLNPSVFAIIPTGHCAAEVTEVTITAGSSAPVKGALLVDNPIDQSMLLVGGQSYYQLSDWISIFSL